MTHEQSISVSMSLTQEHSLRPSVTNVMFNPMAATKTMSVNAANDDEDDEAAFIESVRGMQSVEELQDKLISFYKKREAESYALKNRFTEISRRQKEVFVEVENRRKVAVQRGKKYKQTAQKYHHQVNKQANDMKADRRRVEALSSELKAVRGQKKQREGAIESLTKTIHALKSSLNQTEQSKDLILDEFKQTTGVIGRLIENEKVQEKL